MDWKKRLLALGVFLVLLVSGFRMPGQAMAAESGPGRLTIQLDDIGTPRQGIGFTVYRVGTLEDDVWKLEESLLETGVDLNAMTYAEEWDTAALKLARVAIEAKLELMSGQTDGNGALPLTGLPAGMYLILQDNGKDIYGTVAPFLAALPSREEDGSARWDLTVHPKAERPVEASGGRIRITKRIGYLDPDLMEIVDLKAMDTVYYVGIFRDSRGTVPYGIDYVREIRLQDTGKGEAVFEDLPAGTYYIFETDKAGNAYPVDEIQDEETNAWVCQIEEGSSQEIQLEGHGDAPEGTVGLYNLYYDLPEGFSYNGKITIEKHVLENGKETTTDQTFYAGIFYDAAGTELYELVELEQNGSVTIDDVSLGGENRDEEIAYYVYETDEDGLRVDKNTFDYVVSGEGGVTLTKGQLSGKVSLTNTKKEPTPTPTEGPTVTPTEGASVTPTTPPGEPTGRTSVRTGDDTPILMYVLLAAIALGIALGGAVFLKGRKKHE